MTEEMKLYFAWSFGWNHEYERAKYEWEKRKTFKYNGEFGSFLRVAYFVVVVVEGEFNNDKSIYISSA